jgi:hypothetical protein
MFYFIAEEWVLLGFFFKKIESKLYILNILYLVRVLFTLDFKEKKIRTKSGLDYPHPKFHNPKSKGFNPRWKQASLVLTTPLLESW